MKQTRAFFNRFSIGVTALWLLLFALLPNIGLLVVTVLTRGEQDFVLPQFTLDNYLRLLDPTFLKILWESLWLAFMSTLACLLVGYPFAYRIARASAKMKPWLLLLVIIPFWTNSLIRTYALILILKANGLISTLLVWLGVTEQPVSFMYGDFAVFMGILYTFLPFMVLPLYASIEKLDSRLLDAARDLGASGFQSFWHVTFPLTLPGIIAFTHDLETGERRSTVKQDAVDILRVVDSLDNIHIYNRAIGPQDVPSESASMHNAEVAFCYTSKPMHLVSGSPFQTKKMIKMAEIAAGGKEELKRRPRTAFNHTTISPLRISHEACENAMIVAEAGLPNHILVMVQQGATSPISYAGSVAVHNADFLAFNTLLQCVNRGNPTLYGASACVMDMKKGLSLVAAPEVFVLNAAMARMSKYYNIPSYIAGG